MCMCTSNKRFPPTHIHYTVILIHLSGHFSRFITRLIRPYKNELIKQKIFIYSKRNVKENIAWPSRIRTQGKRQMRDYVAWKMAKLVYLLSKRILKLAE